MKTAIRISKLIADACFLFILSSSANSEVSQFDRIEAVTEPAANAITNSTMYLIISIVC